MPSKSTRRGRPSLGDQVRARTSFTLSPEAVSALGVLARKRGKSASRVVEELILGQPAASDRVWGRIRVPRAKLAKFFGKYGIERAWLFGSVLRPDFKPGSDIDILVNFKKNACEGYFQFMKIQQELEGLMGRPVDLLEERLLDNPIRREEILSTRHEIYAQ